MGRIGLKRTKAFRMSSAEFSKLPAQWRDEADRTPGGLEEIRRNWDALTAGPGKFYHRMRAIMHRAKAKARGPLP